MNAHNSPDQQPKATDLSPEKVAKMVYPHPIIAREGWPFIGVFFTIALIIQLSAGWWAIPFWLLCLFSVQFFRDPPRRVAGNSGQSIVAPADGRVVVVKQTDDPYLNRPALKVSIFMNVFNVHSNRSPVDGEVIHKWYHPGQFFNAALDKASLENERCALHLRLYSGADITCVQIAGLVARRILNYAEKGDCFERGQRFGLIRFGSRVDLYLPLDAEIKVAVGDMVSAASTQIAQLPKSNQV